MNKIKGAALYQYIIIIVLIALALVPVYLIYGQQIQIALMNLVNVQGDINKQLNANTSEVKLNTIKAGELGGTTSNPVEKCNAGICNIDYGDFVLNGVPENFSDHVEAHGTSGGTDSIAALFDQIAEQMKEKSDTEGYEDYKKLAELAHFLADNQEAFENAVSACKDDLSPYDCSSNALNNTTHQTLRESLKDVLPDYFMYLNEDSTAGNSSNKIGYDNIELARYMQKFGNPADFKNTAKRYPSSSFIDTYDTIMGKTSKYSQTLRDLTTKLYQNTSDLSFNYCKIINMIDSSSYQDSVTLSKKDSLTGEEIGDVTFSKADGSAPGILTNPQTSKGTDLNAAIMCVSGKNYDNGNECKK